MTYRYGERREGKACARCECVKFPLFVVHRWFPPRDRALWSPRGEGQRVERVPAWSIARAECIDKAACRARVAKRKTRASVRASRIDIARPPCTDDEQRLRKGFCSWCGGPIWRVNKAGQTVLDGRREYHRAERGEKDCHHEHLCSYAYGARDALLGLVRLRAIRNGYSELRCVDCLQLCVLYVYSDAETSVPPHFMGWSDFAYWEADHVVELEDGGEHAIENIECRCGGCHAAKSAESRRRRRSHAEV